jgi:predicted TPR repeat methyltransferase
MDHAKNVTSVFDSCAKEYQEKYMEVDLYNGSFDLFCDELKQDATILELGCGPGNITKYLLKKRPDLKILGTDLAPGMIRLARKNNPTAGFEIMDCMEIRNLKTRYDAIMCGFCLPYLSKEKAIQLILDSSGLLQDSGLLYLSTMEDDYGKSGLKKSSSGKYELFMYFHQQDYLEQALHDSGFEIIHIKHQDYPTNDETKVIDLIIIAKKITLSDE